MSDPLNNELLSAYLDNEVTDEERVQVEQALADSPETRRSLEALKQVQASLQSVPRLSLPDDFHERVMREAERRAAAQSVTARAPATSKWRRVSAVATTVAALLVIALLVVFNQSDSEIAENPRPDDSGSQALPGDDVVAVAFKRPRPEMILVLDLAITKEAQRDDVFGKALKQAGIRFEPREKGVTLDKRLRQNLLNSRLAADVNQQAPNNGNDEFDVIDMVYVQGTGQQMDDIIWAMKRHQQVRAVMDVAMKPETAQVLNSIGERSWSLAATDSTEAPSSYAYRLNVGIALHSNRSGFLAKFPTPGLDVRILENGHTSGSVTGFNVPIPFDFGGGQPRQVEANEDDADSVALIPFYEILVIRRNLKAGFPQPEQDQKPDAE